MKARFALLVGIVLLAVGAGRTLAKNVIVWGCGSSCSIPNVCEQACGPVQGCPENSAQDPCGFYPGYSNCSQVDYFYCPGNSQYSCNETDQQIVCSNQTDSVYCPITYGILTGPPTCPNPPMIPICGISSFEQTCTPSDPPPNCPPP
jgi:hypothetical protein